MLRGGTDTAAVVAKARKRDGVTADRTLRHGRSAASRPSSTATQTRDLLADPNVVAVVPDEVDPADRPDHPDRRVAGSAARQSDVAGIDGTDQRVDADVAIVDTGIGVPPGPQRRRAATTARPRTATAWRDRQRPRDARRRHRRRARQRLRRRRRRARARALWAVKILNDDGYGLISWYVCGLDWILAQRDPIDPTPAALRGGQHERHQGRARTTTTAASPTTTCSTRRSAASSPAGITVVAAAANDQPQRREPTSRPATTRSSPSRPSPTRTASPAASAATACYSWGGYDKDDTFADFSNYGGDVDLIAPGKCIWSTMPGAGYALPVRARRWRRPTVTGAVALYKASRPNATPAEVREALRYLGNLDWKTCDGPRLDPRAAARRVAHRDARTFDFAPAGPAAQTVETAARRPPSPVHIVRSPTFFERVKLAVTSLPDGWTAAPAPASLIGWTANDGQLAVDDPDGRRPLGRYQITRRGHEPGPHRDDDRPGRRRRGPPDREGAPCRAHAGHHAGHVGHHGPGRCGRRPPIPSSAIAGYEVQCERQRRRVGPSRSRVAAATATSPTRLAVRRDVPVPGPRARRRRQLEPVGGDRARPASHPRRRPELVGRPQRRTGARARARRPGTATAPARAATGAAIVADVHRPRRRPGRARRSPDRGKAKVYIDGVLRRDDQPASRRHRTVGRSCSRGYFAERRQAHDHARGRRHGRIPAVSELDALRRLALGGRTRCDRLAPVRYGDRPDARGPGIPRGDRRGRRGRHGTCDVEGGHPVRAGHHPGQALSGDRVQGHQLQHAPQDGPVADPDEGLVPGRGRADLARSDTVKGYEYAPGEYVVITDEDLENVPLKTVRSIEIEQFTQGRARRRRRPLRQERLLPRARQDRPQGVLPAASPSSRRRA